MADSFEQKYPNITRFIERGGSIELGDHEMIPSFARAYDMGGTVYEGKSSYPSLDDALQDLEDHIKEWLAEMVL